MDVISELNYSEIMRNTIEPFLSEHMTTGSLPLSPPAFITYQIFLNPNAKGNIVISHGFTESAEKFHEMTYYFYQAGYSVFAVNHLGHADSYRILSDTSMTHILAFTDYVDAFHHFIETIVMPNACLQPVYLYGHSMGGAICAYEMLLHPMSYAKVILTSPMIAPLTMNYPMWMARIMAAVAIRFGKKECGVFGQKGYHPEESYTDSPDTSEARFLYYREKRRNNKSLQNTCPTYAWAKESFYVNAALLDAQKASQVRSDVLLFQAENDTFVNNKAEERFAALLPQAKLVPMKGTKHEIYMSDDDTLRIYLSNIFAFLP